MSAAPRLLGRTPSPFSADRLMRAKQFRAGDFPAPRPYDLRLKVALPDWGCMGNDRYGDCTCAALGHLVQAWTANSTGKPVTVADGVIEKFYFQLSPNDQGASMERAAVKACGEGFGGRTFYGYAPVNPDDDTQFLTAGDLFGGVYVGVTLPAGGTDGGAWTTPCSGSIGGHAVAVVADAGPSADEYVCTWGDPRWRMSQDFRRRRCDEAYVLLTDCHFGPDGRTWQGYEPSEMGRWLVALGGRLLNPLPPDPITPPPGPAPSPPPTPGPGGGWDAFDWERIT